MEREAKSMPTHLHDLSLSWLCTGIPIKSGGNKLVLWTQTSPLNEQMCRARVFKFLICIYFCPSMFKSQQLSFIFEITKQLHKR
jgi:hypothetical protein